MLLEDLNFEWSDNPTDASDFLWKRGCLDDDWKEMPWKTPAGGMQVIPDTIK